MTTFDLKTFTKAFTKECLAALEQGRPYPQLSAQNADLSLDEAYALQQAFVHQRGGREPIVGYKAALTAPPAQQAMGLTQPIVGALLNSTARTASTTIAVPPGGILETELGYTLSREIIAPVTIDSVMETVASISPVVEIAHPNLAARPQGIDLVATNSATFGYIKGSSFNLDGFNPDTVATNLSTAGERLLGGKCDEVMAGQRHALVWLINTTLSLGYKLLPDFLLMTGSVGGVAPTQDGSFCATYCVDSQELARIEFDLAATIL